MIVFLVTFFLFTFEALLHYNYGKKTENNERFIFPEFNEFIKIITTVFIFSYIASITVRILRKKFHFN